MIRVSESPRPLRGTQALQRGRWSCPGGSYFITGNLRQGLTGLTDPRLGELIRTAFSALESSGMCRLRTWVLMPDHFHLVFTLCGDFTLGEAIRRLKGPLAPPLRAFNLRWQENFFDHRIRTGEDLLPIFLYVFLNPYRRGLVGAANQWPWYFCCREDWEWFWPIDR
jgi:REP element-mobilizing transposase RayT